MAGFLHWLPLLAALGLLAQVGILGLRPALDEQEFLGYERTQVEARNSQMRARFGEVSREVEAWRDPVYLERLRRWRAAQAKN